MSTIAALLKKISFKTIDDYAQYFMEHHILGRALEELKTNNYIAQDSTSNLFFDTLITELQKKQNGILVHAMRQLKALKEIQKVFPSDHPPICIKGLSCAIICDDLHAIRLSKDIDLFYSDLPKLRNILQELGYVNRNATTATHEDSVYEKNGIYIVIHKYFPIMIRGDYDTANFNKKKQCNLPEPHFERICYEELLHNAIYANNSISSNLLISNAPMSAFILALHIYKDCIWQTYRMPKVRIGDLLDIAELLNLPNFPMEELKYLVCKYNAQYIWNFVLTIASTLPELRLPDCFDEIDTPIFKLTNDYYGPYMMRSKEYLKQLPFICFADFVKEMGFMSCKYDVIYSTKSADASYYASTSLSVFDFSFSVSQGRTRICFNLYIPKPISPSDNICVITDDNAHVHVFFDKYPEAVRIYGLATYRVYDVFESGYSVELSFKTTPDKPPYSVLIFECCDSSGEKINTVIDEKFMVNLDYLFRSSYMSV